ncbi:MAG: hypothetical protein OSJ55_07570 [Bacteroidales bacterium]|nr:hypothetical protein [Bacteroidales bacterium]
MNRYEKHLLRTEMQLDEFRLRYATFIAEEQDRYVTWIDSLPLMVWVNYLQGVPEVNIPVLIGMICHLYCAGLVNISFHESMRMICREPDDVAEWKAWCDSGMTLKASKVRKFMQ